MLRVLVGWSHLTQRGMVDGGVRGWLRRWWPRILLGLVGLFLAIQLVPYGRDHTNPPVVAEPAWDSPETRALAVGACFDCHSNETQWRWYTSVAPFSWLTQRDVDEGRSILNFSEWNRDYRGTGEAAEAVRERGMPPVYYGWMHSSARLSRQEVEKLASGLVATLGGG